MQNVQQTDRDPTDLGLSRTPATASHHCRNGWLGDDDHPVPCPTCKPHLQRRPDGTWRLNRPTKTTRPTKETR